jgi:hypothetical protein
MIPKEQQFNPKQNKVLPKKHEDESRADESNNLEREYNEMRYKLSLIELNDSSNNSNVPKDDDIIDINHEFDKLIIAEELKENQKKSTIDE